ncbi:hypothetical protein NQ315_000970 [Exocentrus adspersus]|uniref:Pre-rRNA-processing protein RIX1 N-terminal domain-containing protein n=1 Tax=Exocentrus adspersus TaxID=1586481 RepID=A0AAV8WF04_9CUCU|nr:hypothetical protein NQ315_000970 [Exocentrus adspersus]
MNSSQIEETLNSPDEAVQSILSTLLNMSMWNEPSEKLLVAAINKLLSVSRTRLLGLEYLNLVIDNCSKEVIVENSVPWVSHCLVKYSEDNLKELKLTTIARIIENSHEEHEFNKKFVSDHISKILEVCLNAHSNYHESEAALKTLGICMKYYGSWFTPHKLRLETFIIGFLESSSEGVVENASLAFHYLQQVGGAGVDGINHKTNFSTSFEKLCATIQKLFDKFFENETEFDQSQTPDLEPFGFRDLPVHTQKMLHVTTRRIKNCLKFIGIMLVKGFPVEKEIKPGDVLDFICRGTAIHRCVSAEKDNDSSLDDFQFCILLTQVHIELLRLLHVLIIWLNASALPFTFTITKILVDCLNKSQSCNCFKSDSIYQETVYTVLACWIRVARGAVHSHFQTQLVKCILKDITPATNKVTLSLQSEVLHKSKKAKQKAVKDKIIASGQENTSAAPGLTNTGKFNKEKLCSFALDTLKHLLIGTILKLQPSVIQEVSNTVLSTLVDIQLSKINHPYTNIDCQAKLYQVLVAFYEQDTLKVLPPLQLTINILSKGIASDERSIALTCEHGLSILEKICQPICPYMFSTDNATLKDVTKESSLFFDANVATKIAASGDKDEGLSLDKLNISGNESDASKKIVSEVSIDMAVDQEIIEEPSSTATAVRIIDMQIIRSSSAQVESDAGHGEEQTDEDTANSGKMDVPKVDTGNELVNGNIVQETDDVLNEINKVLQENGSSTKQLQTAASGPNNEEEGSCDAVTKPIDEETPTKRSRNEEAPTEDLNNGDIGNPDEGTKSVEIEEPPVKRSRTEEALDEVKEEPLHSSQDDVFEEEASKYMTLIKASGSNQNSETTIIITKPALETIGSEEKSCGLLDDVKEEPVHSPGPEPEDDVFEEGSDFVDVVKDY